MCLTTKNLSSLQYKDVVKTLFAKTATKNIIVYKILDIYGGKYFSPYWSKEYKKNTLYKANLGIHFSVSSDSLFKVKVHKGLHAFTSLKTAKRRCSFRNNSVVITTMTIPKGSEYILGNDNDIVSNQLIWK